VLYEKVAYKTRLQKGNRVQIPRCIRWRYKLETFQILKVTVCAQNCEGLRESFLGQMSKDGRITIPKLTLHILNSEIPLQGYVMEITLQPT
jgi:hypothetical protein